MISLQEEEYIFYNCVSFKHNKKLLLILIPATNVTKLSRKDTIGRNKLAVIT